MSEFASQLSERIFNGSPYKGKSFELFETYLDRLLGKNTELNRDDIKKLLTTAQIFLKSDNRNLNQ